jgi:glucose-1-phosphate adenylyltransferase
MMTQGVTVAPTLMNKVGAIILGGGRGTRLYPLTKVRAKPAVPLCGRYRLVDVPISNCIHSGIKRIVVLTQFNSHSLHRHIMRTYQFDRFSGGYVEVLAAEQTNEIGDWFQGTADAVRKQLVHIRDLGAEYYLILSGDQLYRMDYRALLETHLRTRADITVSAYPVTAEAASAFGIMQVNNVGRISHFVEKPQGPKILEKLVTPPALFRRLGYTETERPYLASMGVYIFTANVLESLLESHPDWIDFGREIIPNALRTHRVYAHLFSGFWEDIGTVRAYFEVSMAMTQPNPPFQFHDDEYLIYTHARSLPGVYLENATIRHSIICEGSRITRAHIDSSIIGIRGVVHEDAHVERSIVLGAEYFESEGKGLYRIPLGVGPKSSIRNAIIDHNARIGRNVVIHGSKRLPDHEGDGYVVRDGIVVVLKNAVIPDGTRIA